MNRTSVEQRLLDNRVIDADTGCWRGYGTALPGGYRRTHTGSRAEGTLKSELVHRVAHETWIGPIPEGYDVDHVYTRGCRHRDCFNPAHLEAVTRSENLKRGVGPQVTRARHALKTHCPRGHLYDEENTRRVTTRSTTRRHCRTCENEVRRVLANQ